MAQQKKANNTAPSADDLMRLALASANASAASVDAITSAGVDALLSDNPEATQAEE